MTDIDELLRPNPYPGRGLIIGLSEDGARSVLLYFIMGRSENSRNRVFEKTCDGIRTKAYDTAKLSDPSLVIYNPVRVLDGRIIATNGDQTDTIYDCLARGSDFYTALRTREFEPDAPNYTPRISGLIERDGSYVISILKTAGGNPSCCCRFFFDYPAAIPGMGHFISTYVSDGEPLPSFTGEPIDVRIAVADGLARFADTVWDALDNSNKVSLYARETIIKSGEASDIIINKHR